MSSSSVNFLSVALSSPTRSRTISFSNSYFRAISFAASSLVVGSLSDMPGVYLRLGRRTLYYCRLVAASGHSQWSREFKYVSEARTIGAR